MGIGIYYDDYNPHKNSFNKDSAASLPIKKDNTKQEVLTCESPRNISRCSWIESVNMTADEDTVNYLPSNQKPFQDNPKAISLADYPCFTCAFNRKHNRCWMCNQWSPISVHVAVEDIEKETKLEVTDVAVHLNIYD